MRFFNGPSWKGKDGRIRWAFMSTFDIPCTSPNGTTNLYLRRLRIIQTPWFGVYVHEMLAPDLDADLHDHPWNFYTIILKGGYLEQHLEERTCEYATWLQRWTRWTGHRMTKHEGHRITHLLEVPTYTLVFAGPRTREWGFWTKDGWVKWDEYNLERAV